MAITISQFKDMAELAFNKQPQLPDGAPIVVTTANGALQLNAATKLIRIHGSGTVAWPGIGTPEPFDGTEYRRVASGITITIA